MFRYIKIQDKDKRDADINFKSVKKGNMIYMALDNGEKPINKKVIKSTIENSIEHILNKSNPTDEDYIKFSDKLLKEDSEIDFELFGKFIGKTDKIYTDKNLKPVYNVTVTEQILDPKGELVEEKDKKFIKSNITGEDTVKWTGKYIPKKQLYNKVVLSSKYQLKHVNGLTFDFLFNIAKNLHEKDSFMMLGGGKGNEPLIMNDNGKSYRAFLEGKINGNSYCLIMHLSNQEYKKI
tara:strand:- start:1242 stop:1949 length:708 start_codon:yes stop_codon:yes gene_type:complete